MNNKETKEQRRGWEHETELGWAFPSRTARAAAIDTPTNFTYEGQMSADGGKTWQSTGFSPQSRRIAVGSLTPGTTYTFRFRALGGSTGQSDWSDPVSHMAM